MLDQGLTFPYAGSFDLVKKTKHLTLVRQNKSQKVSQGLTQQEPDLVNIKPLAILGNDRISSDNHNLNFSLMDMEWNEGEREDLPSSFLLLLCCHISLDLNLNK